MPKIQAPKGGVTVAGREYAGGRYLPGGPGTSVWWNGGPLQRGIIRETKKRTGLAMVHLTKKIKSNLAKPVTKEGSVVVRSKRGEYPKKESGELQEGIFSFVTTSGGVILGYCGAEASYAPILENSLDRPFLQRTLNEELPTLYAIMGAPM